VTVPFTEKILAAVAVCTSRSVLLTGSVELSRIVSPLWLAVLLTISSAPPALVRVLSYADCKVVELEAPAAVPDHCRGGVLAHGDCIPGTTTIH
jgi:hypothetical protein